MNINDRQAIEGLLEKLSQVEARSPARDPEAERLITDALSRQPGAPYYMAQTIVAQDQALGAAQTRIAQLEADLAEARRAQQDDGFLSGLFGSAPPLRRPVPGAPPRPQGAPGGFLAGAAQTAMGVAGGVLLADAILGLFVEDAQAATDDDSDW